MKLGNKSLNNQKKIILLSFIILVILILILYIYINMNNVNEYFINNKQHNLEQKKPKIAFCFLTIGNIHQDKLWEYFFNKGNNDKYNIYIHPKYPDKISSYFKNYIIKDLIPTKWGDISLVNATLHP